MPGQIEAVDGVATQIVGDIVVVIWRSAPTLERWQRFMRACESVANESPFGMVCMDLILPSSTPPDAAVRAEMKENFRNLRPKMRQLVVVPLGDSTWLSLVRTLARAVLLVSGLSKQHSVVATVAEGIDAVLEFKSPLTPSREQLHKIVRDLFRALDVPTEQAPAHHA